MHLKAIRFSWEDLLHLNEEEPELRVSDRVVFSTSSSSLRPCAMRAVDVMA